MGPQYMGVAGGLFKAKAVNEADAERERATPAWEEDCGRDVSITARGGKG